MEMQIKFHSRVCHSWTKFQAKYRADADGVGMKMHCRLRQPSTDECMNEKMNE